jgi:predicted alpha/beta superfamily hydrolase
VDFFLNRRKSNMLTLPYTEVIDLESKYNEFEYSLFIRLPNEYKNNDKVYPTLFLLDPEYLFSICYDIRSIYENYIIIGVGHKDLDFKELDGETRGYRNEINRARDFLPWKLDKQIFREGTAEALIDELVSASGYAEKFAQFINHQVIPLIDKRFRTTTERTIIGHSFGGVFASFMLLCHPEFFSKYIIITPVLAPGYYGEKDMFDGLAKKSPTTKKLAYFSIGGEEKDDKVGNYISTLKAACLKIGAFSQIDSKVEVIEGESHASVVTPSIWRGIKFFDVHNQNSLI